MMDARRIELGIEGLGDLLQEFGPVLDRRPEDDVAASGRRRRRIDRGDLAAS
jgi:hypothetical protein